jgi:imidazolonepropionase-like amidohydrolase
MMAIDAGIDIIDHGDEIDGECIDAMAAAGTFLAPSIFFPKTFVEQMGPGLGFTDSMRADLEQMCDALPKANAAGVRLVVGDDYGAMGFPHGRYGAELGVYVRDASIPALDVIRWATVNGAQLLGHGDELGTIAEGKLADLVVVDGDPVDDISVLADADRIVAVLKGGEVVKGTPF